MCIYVYVCIYPICLRHHLLVAATLANAKTQINLIKTKRGAEEDGVLRMT